MARPRKSPEQHKIQGTWRSDRHAEPSEAFQKFLDGNGPRPVPVKPAELSGSASEMWDRVLNTSPGRIWPSHAAVLERYCRFWSFWDSASKAVGGLERMPTVSELTSLGILNDKLLQIEKELGLTPLAQSKMPPAEIGPKKAQVETRPDDIDDHLGRTDKPKKKNPQKAK